MRSGSIERSTSVRGVDAVAGLRRKLPSYASQQLYNNGFAIC